MYSMEYKDGNVVDAWVRGEVDVLMHCCNCLGVWGSGIAAEIKGKIPQAYDACQQSSIYYENPEQRLGRYSSTYDGLLPSMVVNLYGQLKYGRGKRQLNYAALQNALSQWAYDHCQDYIVIGIPYKIGCDRAGGDWEIVSEIFDFVFRNEDVKIVAYKL